MLISFSFLKKTKKNTARQRRSPHLSVDLWPYICCFRCVIGPLIAAKYHGYQLPDVPHISLCTWLAHLFNIRKNRQDVIMWEIQKAGSSVSLSAVAPGDCFFTTFRSLLLIACSAFKANAFPCLCQELLLSLALPNRPGRKLSPFLGFHSPGLRNERRSLCQQSHTDKAVDFIQCHCWLKFSW